MLMWYDLCCEWYLHSDIYVHNNCFNVFASSASLATVCMSGRGFATILNGYGERVAPVIPSALSSTPSRVEKWNLWHKPTKNKNSSIFARPSPRHARFPGNTKQKTFVTSQAKCFWILLKYLWCESPIGTKVEGKKNILILKKIWHNTHDCSHFVTKRFCFKLDGI